MPDSDLDIVSLGHYLRTHIAGFTGLRSADKFPDGQSNPTYLLTTDSGQYVLRRQPFGELLRSAHAVDREYRVMQALQTSSIPVPHALHLCTDRAQIGSLFYVMSFEPGRVLWNPALPEFSQQERTAIYDEMNRVMTELHSVDINQVGLQDFGKPGNYFERQINRWTRQYRASETSKLQAMDKLIQWLPQHTPPDDGKVSLIHGDYRLDNIIFQPDTPNIKAVLDWELSTLGHPFADLAYQCMQLRMPQESIIAGLGNCDRAALGIPTEQEYVATYCARRGLSEIPNWSFYVIFSLFRFAAILQGVNKRAMEGNASSQKAFEYGAMTPELAKMAVELIGE